MKHRTKICRECGIEFEAKKDCKSRNQIYCTRKCYWKTLEGKKATQKQLEVLAEGRKIPRTNKGSHWTIESKIRFSLKKKGMRLSISHRKALSIAKKGIRYDHLNTAEVRNKISMALLGKPQPWNRGENHPNWQGGKTGINAKIRNSLEMKEWRRKVFKRDEYTCQECKAKGGRLVADHIKPFSVYPELRFGLSNGRTICHKCDLKSKTYGGRALKCKN